MRCAIMWRGLLYGCKFRLSSHSVFCNSHTQICLCKVNLSHYSNKTKQLFSMGMALGRSQSVLPRSRTVESHSTSLYPPLPGAPPHCTPYLTFPSASIQGASPTLTPHPSSFTLLLYLTYGLLIVASQPLGSAGMGPHGTDVRWLLRTLLGVG